MVASKEASLAPEWQEELERAWGEIDHLHEEIADLTHQLHVVHENLAALGRWVPGDDDAEEEPEDGASTPTHVRMLPFASSSCGGNETQERYRARVDASVAGRYQGMVEVEWFLPGWSSNWATSQSKATLYRAVIVRMDPHLLW